MSPCDIPLFPRLFFYKVKSDVIDILPDNKLCEDAGIPTDKVAKTIDEFNLNCRRLGEARLKLYTEIENEIRRLRTISDNPKQKIQSLIQYFLTRKPDGSWHNFFTLIRWRFGAYAEQHLNAINYQG